MENARAQMRKGVLDFAVMLVVSRGAIYAPDIIEELKGADMKVVEGTIYPLLNRLKEAGFLEYEWRESKSGPPRKYYRMTNMGRKVISEFTENWNDISGSIIKLIKKEERPKR